MRYEPQIISAPDGTELVIMLREDYERLKRGVDDDAADIAAAQRSVADSDGFAVPHEVVKAMLIDGQPPVAAWRRYRGLTQAALAMRAGLTQTAISAFEIRRKNGQVRLGRIETRRALAEALAVPLWALEQD